MFAGRDGVSTLGRLLLLGDAVELRDLEPLMAGETIVELVATGILVNDGDAVRAPYRVDPFDRLLLASDHRWSARLQGDVVIGVNPSAITTANLTPHAPVDSMLDLGTGCGIHALFGATHSERVVGVDINPRALSLARLNARLNGVTNVSWMHGDWLQPVRGRRFNLIVANPPYVISPQATYLYRDSGLAPGALVGQLIEQLPAHLEEDGIAQVMLDWDCTEVDHWSSPVKAWLSGSDCDALILRFGTSDPVTYAAAWNAHLAGDGAGSFDDALERWLAFHRMHDIQAIASGAVFLRRRSGTRNWVAALEAPKGVTGPAGDHVLRLFDGHDRLAELRDPGELLDYVFTLVRGHRIDQTLTYPDGRYHSHPAAVRVSPGLEIVATIDPDAVPTLSKCDGRRSLRELVGDDSVGAAVACDAVHAFLAAGLLVAS